jgi:hypothetical protein
MKRLFRPFTLALALAAAMPACGGAKASGTPTETLDGRTLAGMLPYITKSLTPLLAEQRFGVPDARQNTGTVVMVYNVEEGKTVSLGFPALDQTITFARLTAPGGTITDLPIAP